MDEGIKWLLQEKVIPFGNEILLESVDDENFLVKALHNNEKTQSSKTIQRSEIHSALEEKRYKTDQRQIYDKKSKKFPQ